MPLFPDRDLTPGERWKFHRLLLDGLAREQQAARKTFRYWTQPLSRERILACNRQSSDRTRPPLSQVVYFAYCPETGLTKIGTSGYVSRQLKNLRWRHHASLDLVWSTPGGHELKEAFHRHFADRRHGARSEWFDLGCKPARRARAALPAVLAQAGQAW